MRRAPAFAVAALLASVQPHVFASTPVNVRATVNSGTSVTITWNAVTGGATYEVRRSTGGAGTLIGSTSSTTFTDNTAAANTAYLYRVRVTGDTDSTPAYAGTFVYTDPTLVAGSTKVKAAHVSELRTAANAMRTLAGLSATSFADPTLSSTIKVRAIHVTELRSSINGARGALGIASAVFTDPTITAGVTKAKAIHVDELRQSARQASAPGAVLNGPPVFTSSSAFNVAENTTAVATVTTTDPEGNPRTYAIDGGADAAKFSIHATTGALAFLSAPDFEQPTDAGTNNVYDVVVTASDGQGNVAGMAIAVTVTDVVEGCVSLALGGVFTVTSPVPSSICLSGGAEYTVTVTNVSDAAAIDLRLTATDIVPVTGPPVPSTPFSPPRGEKVPKADEGSAKGSDAITPGAPSVGAIMSLNVETDNLCSTFDTRKGRVEVVGTHVIVMQEVVETAPGSGTYVPAIANGFATADFQDVADEFDNVIRPAVTTAFGTPADIDSNQRVIAFYTSAVNALTPNGSQDPVEGLFLARDLEPIVDCGSSNVGEMIYLQMADPSGTINGNVRSVSSVKETTMRALAHELGQLVNASRRMYVNTPFVALEEPWLDEALGGIAEELAFHQASGLTSRSNLDAADLTGAPAGIDAFFRYQEPGFGRLRQWLIAPEGSGPVQSDLDRATRGAGWAFLRYAADRNGGSETAFWQALVNTQDTGLTNLQNRIGTSPATWMSDFATAMYADDAVSGVAATFTQPSWNFREIYSNLDYNPGPACSCAYELAVRNPTDGVTDNFTLAAGGGAAFLRMGVAMGDTAQLTLRVAPSDTMPPSTVRMTIFRRE